MDGVFYINKPKNMTSFDVVAQIRKKTKQKAVGHTGTLDPNAEGLLIILLGKSCKCLPYCEHDRKEYIGTMKFGIKTDTADIWGKTISEKAINPIDKEEFLLILNSFVGESTQIPPMVSSIKVDGKKLIDYHREGKRVELKPRKIIIHELECLSFGEEIKLRACVSSGTYIRTLCEDIAEKTGNIGTMTALVRTKIGPISLDQSLNLAEIDEHTPAHTLYEVLQGTLPIIEVNSVDYVKQGKQLHLNCDEDIVLLSNQGELLAAYEKCDEHTYRCKRGLW